MIGLVFEPVSLAIGVSAAASAAVLLLVRRLRRDMRGLRDDVRVAQARVLVSEALLSGEGEALSAAMPAVGLLAGAVTAVFPVLSPSQRSRFLVAAPPDRNEPPVRAAAALLAAVSVSCAEVPEFARAVRSGLPQRGVDLGPLLRRGVTSLPFATRDKLFERLKRTPFLVVPVVRPDSGAMVGLLLALGRREDLDRLGRELSRVATRLALLIPTPRKGPVRVEAGSRRARPSRPLAPRDAEIILWLDAEGAVAACEPLQDEWVVEPPRTLQQLFGAVTAAPLLRQASREAPVSLGLARIDDERFVEVSLLRLADGDAGTWGYAAFLRRVVSPLQLDAGEESSAPSLKSRASY